MWTPLWICVTFLLVFTTAAPYDEDDEDDPHDEDVPHVEGVPKIKIMDGKMEKNETHISVGLGMNFTLECSVEVNHNIESEFYWNLPNSVAKNEGRSQLSPTIDIDDEEFQNVTITNASMRDEGKYECVLKFKNNSKQIPSVINISVIDVYAPVISNSKNINGKTFYYVMDKNYERECLARGYPNPQINWLKDNRVLKASSRVSFKNNNQILVLENVGKDTVGRYSCTAKNSRGYETLTFYIAIQEDKASLIAALIAVFIVSIIIVIIFVTMARRIKKEKELRNALSESWVKTFEEGSIGNINPDLGVDEQAELLPYDPIWEFERDRLKLGHQLGSGEFGVVMKGEAIGINDCPSITTVAVKMVRKNAESSHVKALATELKIMSHLGKHLNVVNLLGACTRNLAKRELLVIVEYCKYGNLQGILLRHRHVFVNQLIDDEIHVTEKCKPDYLENVVRPTVKYTPVSWRQEQICVDPLPETARSGITSLQSGSSSNYQWSSGNTDVSEFSDQSSEYTKMDSTVVFLNGKYETEDKSIKAIRTQDLLCWGFQIARGMDYLASRKVLHGDLAARNILLADDNVVKICDFGLARSVYKNENYFKTENIPLPVKWMAIESIQDHVFSIQSDIWSYGVLLWELFSLAKSPYPGVPVDQSFLQKLVEGYRMEKPNYASTGVYEIMQECWQEEPGQRPPFSQIEEKLGDLLENSVKCHYVDKNTQYMVMNTMKEKQSDYLEMMSAPTYCNEIVKQSATPQDSQEPQYINLTEDVAIEVLSYDNGDENVDEGIKENVDDGYLSMGAQHESSSIVNKDPNSTKSTSVDTRDQNNQIDNQNPYIMCN